MVVTTTRSPSIHGNFKNILAFPSGAQVFKIELIPGVPEIYGSQFSDRCERE